MALSRSAGGCVLTGDEIFGRGKRFLIDGLHPLFRQRASIFNNLAAFTIGLTLQDAAGTKLLPKRLAVRQNHIAGIIAVFRLFFGV